MERCPCCNARLRSAKSCSRCQANLGMLIATEQAARFWLVKAIRYWREGHIESSLLALERSLRQKKTVLGMHFRSFLIEQCSQNLLILLSHKNDLLALQYVYEIRRLVPLSKLLQQVQRFIEYRWIQDKITETDDQTGSVNR